MREGAFGLAQTGEGRLRGVVVEKGGSGSKPFTHRLGMGKQLGFLLERFLLAGHKAGGGKFVELELKEIGLATVLCLLGSERFERTLEGNIFLIDALIGRHGVGHVHGGSKVIEEGEAERTVGKGEGLVLGVDVKDMGGKGF